MALLCIRIVDKIYFYAMVPQTLTVHISDQALITLELFLLRYVRFNGQKFSGLPEKLSLNPRFFF